VDSWEYSVSARVPLFTDFGSGLFACIAGLDCIDSLASTGLIGPFLALWWIYLGEYTVDGPGRLPVPCFAGRVEEHPAFPLL